MTTYTLAYNMRDMYPDIFDKWVVAVLTDGQRQGIQAGRGLGSGCLHHRCLAAVFQGEC